MIGAPDVGAPPAQSGAAIDEPFLRRTIFEALVGLLAAIGAITCLYLALTGEPPNARLWLFGLVVLLVVGLVCLIDAHVRMLDMHEGPGYFGATVTKKRPALFGLGAFLGLGGQVELGGLPVAGSLWGRIELPRFEVSKEDFAQIQTGDQLRVLLYPNTGTHVAAQYFDSDTQRFVWLSPVSGTARIWQTLGYVSQGSTGSLIMGLLTLLLLPLWLLATLIAFLWARRTSRPNPSFDGGGHDR